MTISLSQSRLKPYNDMYPDRPVWAVVSHPVAANSPMVAMYGERSPFVPLAVEAPAIVRSRAGRGFADEAFNQTHYYLGTATNPAVTGAYSLTTGMVGATNFSQTGCLANFEISDNGNFGWYSATNSESDKLAIRSGIVVGESNWRQCYDLVLTENLRLYKAEIGGGYTYAAGANRPYINLAGIFAEAGTSAGGNSGVWGVGQVAHNRNTGRLLVVQPRGGTNNVNLIFRLHFLDLQNKIGRDTSVLEIQSWVNACMADPARYRFVDVTFNTTRATYTNDSSYESAGSEFVLCDNDEVWMFRSSETASTGSSKGNSLFRVNLTGGNWKTGEYAATEVVGFTNTNQFGHTTGPWLGARHMNSDDNSVVALYQHNYYYNIGLNLAMVSTKDAGPGSFSYITNTTNTTSFAIAPCGGPDFVLCQTNANQDGVGPRLAFTNNEVHTGTAEQLLSWQTNIWPSVGTSTMYGANIVVKVQPTTEWK